MAKRALVILDLQNSKFVKGLSAVNTRWGKFRKSIFSVQSALQATFVGIAAYKLGAFLKSSIGAFQEQQDAQEGLAAALKMIGKYSAGAVLSMADYASELQSLTTYGDEVILQTMAMGASMGKLSGQQLKEATKAAMGLAAAYGMNLETAMENIARQAAGGTPRWAQYGVVLTETKDKAKRLAEVLKIGGAAFSMEEARTKTFSGQVKQLANSFGDLKERMGAGIAEGIMGIGKSLGFSAKNVADFDKQWGFIIQKDVAGFCMRLAAGIAAISAELQGMWAIAQINPITQIYELFTGGPGQLFAGVTQGIKGAREKAKYARQLVGQMDIYYEEAAIQRSLMRQQRGQAQAANSPMR